MALRKSLGNANIGPNRIALNEHMDQAGLNKSFEHTLVQGEVITVDPSAAPVLVYQGNICRVRVTATTYIAFGDESMAAVTVATSPALELGAGTHLIAATSDWVRMSAAPARLEVIQG